MSLSDLEPYDDGHWPIGNLICEGTEPLRKLIETATQPRFNLDKEHREAVLHSALAIVDELEELLFAMTFHMGGISNYRESARKICRKE